MARPLLSLNRPLFSPTPICEVFEARRRTVAAHVAALPPEVFQTPDLDELAADLVKTYRFDPLVLDWAAAEPESRDVEIDTGGPAMALGTEFTRVVPFVGFAGLFDMQPSTHAESPPWGFVRRSHLLLSYAGVDRDPATVRTELDQQQAAVQASVAWIRTDVDAFNADLTEEVRRQLQARFDKARADADVVAALGGPLRQRPTTPSQHGAADGRESTVAPRLESGPPPRRGPGRPPWTPELFGERLREAQAATPEPQILDSLAEHFRARDGVVGGVGGPHLGRLRTRYEEKRK